MAKKYIVNLTPDERAQLLALVKKGRGAARKLRRAQLLLLADEGSCDATIAASLHVDVTTVERTRRRCVEEGVDAALTERHRLGGQAKLQGKAEAFLVALACSAPPEGRQRWTMQLLADRLVELDIVASISDDAVRRTLKKTPPNPG
jgi:transposase